MAVGQHIAFEFQTDVEVDLLLVETWLRRSLDHLRAEAYDLTYVFLSDEKILEINKKYLDHDYYTDIITFDLSEDPKNIQSDIFISVDRVRENAKDFNCPFEMELRRVLIHGVLHLLGYGDSTDALKNQMRKKEDELLSI